MSSIPPQKGLSLVELMIAITLGSVMLAAATQFLLGDVMSYRLDDDLARIQDNGREALDILIPDLRLAGYPPSTLSSPGVTPPACGIGTNENSLPCGRNGKGSNSDTLAIQYAPPATIDHDCTGTRLNATDGVIVNMYSVADIDGDGVRSLYCRGYSVAKATWLSAPTPLVDGIDALQVLYEVYDPDTDTYSYRSLDRLTPRQVAHILAVHVALLVSDGLNKGYGKRKTRRYQLLDSEPLVFRDDNHLRRVFSTTVQLNNALSGATP